MVCRLTASEVADEQARAVGVDPRQAAADTADAAISGTLQEEQLAQRLAQAGCDALIEEDPAAVPACWWARSAM